MTGWAWALALWLGALIVLYSVAIADLVRQHRAKERVQARHRLDEGMKIWTAARRRHWFNISNDGGWD